MHGRPRLRHDWLTSSGSSPSTIVALFHGLGGSRKELRPLAERWLPALPSTAFLLLEAPDRDYHGRELLNGEWSGDWYPFPKLRSAFDDDGSYESMVEQCVSDRCDHVSSELDHHLESVGLGNDRLILAGFSQGAAISAYTGLRRGCLGVLPMGGPCPPRERLLPPNDKTRICAIVGDADHCVPHEEIRQGFAKYVFTAADGAIEQNVHVVPGGIHEALSEENVRIGLAFLRSCVSGVQSH